MAKVNDLLINNKNAFDNFGVRMGKGFVDTIEAAVSLKDPIENEVRTEHGTRMLVNTKKAKRSINLLFNIHGASETEFLANKKLFEQELYNGKVDIQIVGRTEIYHLVYTGKNVTYKHSYSKRFGTMMCGFIEPNPNNRTAEDNADVRVMA